MKRLSLLKSVFCVGFGAVLPLIWMACGGDENPAGPTDEKTCSEIGDSLKTAQGGDISVYRVIRPNGGETYRIGDTVHIRAASNINLNNSLLELLVTHSGITDRITLNPGGSSMNLYQNCDLPLVLSDSMSAGSKVISLVSDSIKVRASNYQNNTQRDLSDGYFRVLPR